MVVGWQPETDTAEYRVCSRGGPDRVGVWSRNRGERVREPRDNTERKREL